MSKWVELQKIGGNTPKWMVKIMENPIFIMDDLGETHSFWKHPNRFPTKKMEDSKVLFF